MSMFRPFAAAAMALLPLAATPARAADCTLAIEQAQYLANAGRKALASWNYVESAMYSSDARIPAIEAVRLAKACGCNEAVAPLTEVSAAAGRANVSFNIDMSRGYANQIIKQSDLAIAALRACSARS